MIDKLESMIEANKIASEILETCKNFILKNGITKSREVSILAKSLMTRHDVKSAFYGVHDFPDVICISVNDCVIHGLANDDFLIQIGDLVSLDTGVIIDGYYSDMAISFINNNITTIKKQLVDSTKKSLNDAINYLKNSYPNCKLIGITNVINKYSDKYGIVKGFGGHGIGKNLHDRSIWVANNWNDFHGDKTLQIGDFFTIEPMFTLGKGDIYTDTSDGFSIRTKDKSLSAHFEVTVAITSKGITVL